MKMLLKTAVDTGFVCLVTVDLIYLFIYLSDIFNIVFLCSLNPCNFFSFFPIPMSEKGPNSFALNKQINKQITFKWPCWKNFYNI